MVRMHDVEIEREQLPSQRRAERHREREVRVRGGRDRGHADDRAPLVGRPAHAGRDDDDAVAEDLEAPPDRLDGGRHTAEHREVVVREETDPEARGRRIGYILYRPKSSGFRFSSHSLSFS